jgi:hypothetical protein
MRILITILLFISATGIFCCEEPDETIEEIETEEVEETTDSEETEETDETEEAEETEETEETEEEHPEQPTAKLSIYDSIIMIDTPVAFWNKPSGNDFTSHAYHGTLINNPTATKLPNGDSALVFNGTNQYIEISSKADFSVPTTGILTIEAWMRPDVLNFQVMEGSGYVYWMGKGTTQAHEYACRMYGQYPTGNDAPRINRISGYAFNPSGGLGAGSYYQAASNVLLQSGEWIHYVLIINTKVTSPTYPTGYTKLYVHRKNSSGTITTYTDQDALEDYDIIPVAGNAPFRIGTRDMKSYFEGSVGKIALYNYELSSTKIREHATKMFE